MNPERNMSEKQNNPPTHPEGPQEPLVGKRPFLAKLGRWSGASVAAAIGGVAWIASAPSAKAGWLNRGSWVNRRGGGGGGWINRRGGGGGGSWVNRGSGSWVNRRGGGGWINRR